MVMPCHLQTNVPSVRLANLLVAAAEVVDAKSEVQVVSQAQLLLCDAQPICLELRPFQLCNLSGVMYGG